MRGAGLRMTLAKQNGSMDGAAVALGVTHPHFEQAGGARGDDFGMVRSESGDQTVEGGGRDGAALGALPGEEPVAVPRDLRRRRRRCLGGSRGHAESRDNACGAEETAYQPDVPFFSRLASRSEIHTTQRIDDGRRAVLVFGSGATAAG